MCVFALRVSRAIYVVGLSVGRVYDRWELLRLTGWDRRIDGRLLSSALVRRGPSASVSLLSAVSLNNDRFSSVFWNDGVAARLGAGSCPRASR
jgi:hypothetical protein